MNHEKTPPQEPEEEKIKQKKEREQVPIDLEQDMESRSLAEEYLRVLPEILEQKKKEFEAGADPEKSFILQAEIEELEEQIMGFKELLGL